MSNIKPFGIAEPFDKYVKDQIRIRQQKKASGLGKDSRTPEELSYLISQNAWVRCASSTDVTDITRLTKMGFNQKQAESLRGQSLAKQFVLFNGTSDNDDYSFRRGGYNTNGNRLSDAAYGLGGLDFGQVPMPGIQSFSISHITNGALRQGTLTMVANNRVQYNILDALYIRLGHSIFVEWGNNMYFDNQSNFITNLDTQTLIEDGTWFDAVGIDKDKNPFLQFADKISQKRESFSGNYDAFMGKVVNFETSFTPSGQFQIRLDLVSTGDVMEGLKVNSLTTANLIPDTPDENSDLQIAAEGNMSDIRNYLYCINNIKESEFSEFNKKGEKTGLYDFVDLSTQDNIKTFIQEKDLQYIRLGKFLDFIETFVVPHRNNIPICNIDIAAESNMRLFDGIVSTDPSKCVISTRAIKQRNVRTESAFKFFEYIEKEDNPKEGIIGNIYFKITHLQEKMQELIGDDPTTTVSLLDLLEKICDSINSCFGGYVNIQPGIQDDITAYLRDTLFQPKEEDSDVEKETEDDQDSLIKIFGFTPSSDSQPLQFSSIVTDYMLKTEISSDLSAQLSIGAAGNNQSTANINPFFEAISKGLSDIYQQGEVTDGTTDTEAQEKHKFFVDCKVSPKKPTKNYKAGFISGGGIGATGLVEDTSETQAEQVNNQEKKEKSLNTKESAKSSYEDYISKMFDVRGISAKNRYFLNKKSDSQIGASKLSMYVNSLYGYTQKIDDEENVGGGSSLVNFIPIKLQLTLDGISGIKIYNRLSVDTEFLPINYPEVIDFIVLGISHTLQENKWSTTIDTLSIPGRNKNNISKVTESEQQGPPLGPEEEPTTAREPNDVVIFAPTGVLPLNIRNPRNNQNRNDNKGGGYFGASRNRTTGPGPHEGVDLVTTVPPPRGTNSIDLLKEFPLLRGRTKLAGITQTPQTGTVNPTIDIASSQSLISGKGTVIFSPITGNLVFTTASSDAVLPGAKIEGTGKYKGYRVKLFYFAPTLKAGPVFAGQPIGNAVEITLQPKYAGVSNHLHFGVERLGEPIDPETLNYTTNPADTNVFTSILSL